MTGLRIFTLHTEQFVPESLDKVFEFFSRPENLAEITPKRVDFKILTPPPIEMKSGALISYAIRILVLRVRWTSLITTYNPPDKFVDEQLKGPYLFWHHTHTFSENENGTLIIDEVRYALPFSFVGSLMNKIFIRRQLRYIFNYRAKVIAKIFNKTGNDGSEVHLNNIIFGEIKI